MCTNFANSSIFGHCARFNVYQIFPLYSGLSCNPYVVGMHFLFTIRVLQPPDTPDVCGLMQGREHWTNLCTIPTV